MTANFSYASSSPMAGRATAHLARRLPWLLVFRAGTATALLLVTLTIDLSDWPLRNATPALYAMVTGSFLVVLVLGVLLRAGVTPIALSVVHLGTAILTAALVVHTTGGVDSAFSFLFLLAIVDGAIVGFRQTAFAVASASALAYGGLLLGQLYSQSTYPSPERWSVYTSAALLHTAAFFLLAVLAAYLAELLRQERDAAVAARHDLRAAKTLHATVLGSLPLGVVTTDALGTIRTVNAAAALLLGHSHDVWAGQALPPVLRRFVGRVASSEEVTWSTDDGVRILSVSSCPVQGEFESQGLNVVVFEDRTELRALEDALRQRERLASIGELSAAIAHELRNPLAAISGSVELLSGSAEGDADRERLQGIVLREIERLNGLVGDFLVYARPSPLQPLLLDVVALADELCEVLRQDASWHRHVVRLEAPDRYTLHIDPLQVRQMLWNLLRNALDASPPEAPIRLRIVPTTRPRGVVLEVIDRGSGIPPELQHHLFEPFRTSKRHGTGLGLAVVHRIVDNHGGQIRVITSPGAGTTMRVELPEQPAPDVANSDAVYPSRALA